MDFSILNEDILTQKEVAKKLRTSRTGLHNMVKAGEFVPPIRIGIRRVGWLVSDVDKWLDKRIAERRGGTV